MSFANVRRNFDLGRHDHRAVALAGMVFEVALVVVLGAAVVGERPQFGDDRLAVHAAGGEFGEHLARDRLLLRASRSRCPSGTCVPMS